MALVFNALITKDPRGYLGLPEGSSCREHGGAVPSPPDRTMFLVEAFISQTFFAPRNFSTN